MHISTIQKFQANVRYKIFNHQRLPDSESHECQSQLFMHVIHDIFQLAIATYILCINNTVILLGQMLYSGTV